MIEIACGWIYLDLVELLEQKIKSSESEQKLHDHFTIYSEWRVSGE